MRGLTTARGLALALGSAASIGAAYILLKDDVVAGQWSDSFVLVPLMLGIAVVAGHLAAKASRDRSFLAASGFALAFFLGTALTVYQSVAKQAATTDAKMLETVASNKDRSMVEAQLQIAQTRYSDAISNYKKLLSPDGSCLTRKCMDSAQRISEVEARQDQLRRELKSMDPVKPVAAGPDRVAQVIHVLFGLETHKVKALLVIVEPFAFSLLFELTAISAFGYGFGGSRRPVRAANENTETQPTVELPEPPGDRRDPAIVSWVEEFTRRNGRAPQIPEVQQAFEGLGKTTAWRYCKDRHRAA
jgi:hypothetical protein